MARTGRDLGSLSRMASEKSTEEQIYEEAYRRGWEDAHSENRDYPRKRHGCLKSIFVALVIILALLIYFVSSSPQNPTVRKSSSRTTPTPTATVAPTEKPAPLAYSATGLFSRYAENEIAANEDLKNKIVKVTGVINYVSVGLDGEPYIGLERDKHGLPLVSCYFKKENSQKLRDLKAGQTVSIIGTCTGYLIGVYVHDCDLE